MSGINRRGIRSVFAVILSAGLAWGAVAQMRPGAPAQAGAELPTFPLKKKQKAIEGTLSPGESFESGGVKLTWHMKAGDEQTSEPMGYVSLKGPKSELAHVSVVSRKDLPREGPTSSNYGYVYYLDNMAVQIRGSFTDSRMEHGRPLVEDRTINYSFTPQPSHFKASAGPLKGSFFLSADQPVTIHPLEFTLTKEAVTYPDGVRSHQIIIRDRDSGSSVTLPARANLMRRIGRFDVAIDVIWEDTLTAGMKLWTEQPDPRPQGGDSYAILETPLGSRLEDYLNQLSQKYHFSVEWVSTGPGSVEFLKDLKAEANNQFAEVLRDGLENVINLNKHDMDKVALEWPDAAHLRVRALNYDKVLALREIERKKQDERESQAAEQKQFKDKFAQEYAGDLKIYTLSKISAAAARALVEPELGGYYLVRDPRFADPDFLASNVVARGKSYAILKSTGKGDPAEIYLRDLSAKEPAAALIEMNRETVAADDRANALIVRAALVTQRRVSEILITMDGLYKEKEKAAAGPLVQYRIEVILLEGKKKKNEEEKPLRQMSPDDRIVRVNDKEYVLISKDSSTPNKVTCLYLNRLNATTATVQKEFARTPPAPGYEWLPITMRKLEKEELLINFEQRIKDEPIDEKMKSPSAYGIASEDLKVMGLDSVSELGRGVVALAGQKGELGSALVALNENYRCQLEFQDLRQPYLIVKGSLMGARDDKPLLSNTLFLEPDKPTLLGLTNMKAALILLVRQAK